LAVAAAVELLAAAPLIDEVVRVVDQQLQLAQRLLTGLGTLQLWLVQCGSRDRDSVDPVGLAATAATAALRSGQPRRHPHQPLALLEQHLLKPVPRLRRGI
jgi:hypothetical protein